MSSWKSSSSSFLCMLFCLILSTCLSFSTLVHAQSRDNIEVTALPLARLPATGTFRVNVYYVATGNRALVAEVQLKANAATKFGRGSVNVNAGSGSSTITVTLANNPTPSNTLYVLNVWVVDSATYNNGNNPNAYAQRSSGILYDVLLGNPTTAPPTLPPTTAPTVPRTTTTPTTTTATPTPTPTPTDAVTDPPIDDSNNDIPIPIIPVTDAPPLISRIKNHAPSQHSFLTWMIVVVLGWIGKWIL